MSNDLPQILIIDDDANVRRLFMQLLSREPYRLVEAENGKQGLSQLAQSAYDLVITDLQMDNVDGLQILQAARKKDRDVQVLIITGYGSVATAVHAMKIGAFDYLTKPIQSETLLIKVSNALQHRRLQLLLREQEKKLSEHNQLMQQDLELARQVQASLVPAPHRTGWISVDVRYHPMLGIGGDFADVYDDGCGHVLLTVVDVTGHGIAAALMVNRIYSEWRLHVRAGRSPRQILHRLNEFSLQTFTGISLFLTMMVVHCDLEQKKLTWAGSAHPSGLLLPQQGPVTFKLPSQNRILGFSGGPVEEFIEQERAWTTGDRLVLYTDGLVETENENGEPLAVKGLTKLADQCRGLTTSAAVDALTQRTIDYGNGKRRDDLLLLVADFL